MISGFFDEYRWLSNFWEVDIIYDGITYPTVEHYYVAMKIDDGQIVNVSNDNKVFLDIHQLRRYISEIKTPGEAKRFGREQLKVRKDWDDMKISIMRYGLIEKFSKEPFKTKLINTHPMKLVESNNWGDTFWGVCGGVGKNVLGKLIMEIRSKQISIK